MAVETGSPEHLKLVRDYNSVHPLPVGYPVKNTDDWCDVFVTTVFQREGLSHLIGRECGVERHIQIFKHLGIWNENGTSTPKSGDIITFNPTAAYPDNEIEVSSLLKIKKEEVAEHKGNFSYQITEISRFVKAENNEDLWKNVYGEDADIKTEADFRNKIAEG